MADTPTGETVTPGDSQTTVPTPAPTGNAADQAEVERLRKEAEQQNLRIRQLENERVAREKADEETKRRELEEKEEYKTLYEKTEAELKTRREKEESETRSKELATAGEAVLKDYPKEVQELAATAGISLTDDSEAGKALLKEKLDAIKSKLPNTPQVDSNNGYSPSPGNPETKTLVTPDETGATPMALASAKGDLRLALKYIGGLDSINQLKKMSGYYR